MKKLFCLFVCLSLATAHAKDLKKHNLSICSIFRNEASYLKEWIEYHKLIGVDHFYLYDNLSSDFFRRVVKPYVDSDLVTLIYWPDNLKTADEYGFVWALSTQVPAYENAIQWRALKETKWLVCLEIDEFLVPCSKGIAEILSQYDEYAGIDIDTESFNASKRSTLPPRKLVIEAIERTKPAEKMIQRMVAKTILKPELCTGFSWPPYKCNFKPDCKIVKISKNELRINSYQNRMKFQKIDKIKKTLVFDRETPPENEINELLKMGYEIEDQERAIQRFMPDLYKKMGLSIGEK